MFLFYITTTTYLKVSPAKIYILPSQALKYLYDFGCSPWTEERERERERCHIGYIDIITTDHPGLQACVFDYNILILSISNVIVYCYKFCVYL